MSCGKVVQVIGPVVDVQFPLSESLPDINNALKVKLEDGTDLIIEVTLNLAMELCAQSQWIPRMV